MPIQAGKHRLTTIARAWGSWLALVLGLCATALLSFSVKSDIEASAKREFEFACKEIQLNIAARLAANAQILYSGAALFNTADTVTRSSWKAFVDHLRVDQFLPGTQGIGYAVLIPANGLEQHVLSIRKEGFPDYLVKPAGQRATYSSIQFLEPFSGRNLRAFGFDMFSEPVRRAALERARDLNQVALTGKVTLVQETDKDVQAGALMFVPVYRKHAPIASVDQRRTALAGWVYSPYRMKDLMQGTLRGWDVKIKDHPIVLQVYDGDTVSRSSLLYDSRSHADSALDTAGIPIRSTSVDFAGRRWTLRISQPGKMTAWRDFQSMWSVLLSGSIISLLLFVLVRSLSNIRSKAEEMAAQLTRELRESEESYRNQFATNSSVMLLVDPGDGSILDANGAALRFYGYSREQILSMKISDINTLPIKKVLEAIGSVPQGNGSRFQFRHRLSDGSQRDVEVSASNIQFGGRPVVHSIIHDITERKLAEEASRQLSERLSLATRAGGVGIWDYDIVGNKLIWDEQMYKLYGISSDTFGGAYDAWRKGLHPEDRARGDEEIRRAIEGEKEFDTEFRVVWPDGSVRHIRALALVQRGPDGRAIHMTGTNWDITVQNTSEEALRRSEKRITQLLQTTDQGIYGIDPEGNCTFMNRSGLKMLGYELQECLGRNMHDLIHHSRIDGTRYPVSECPIFLAKTEGSGSRIDSEVFWRKDNSKFPVEYSSYPVIEDGTIHGAVVTFSDITERRLSDETLRASNIELAEATSRANALAAQAEKANAAKSEFLANMSHEIRTPMNGVLGMANLLLDTDLDPEQRRVAEIIGRSGESLLALINDILDISKIEAGKLELDCIDFDLRALLDDITASNAPRIHDKGLEFVGIVSPDLPNLVRGDPGRLRQILLNLLSNATKFTAKGRIALITETESETETDTTIRFRVQDTGIGIPPEKQGMLFQKFTQVDASTTRQFGGTGLGLAISRQLTEMMGGRIGIRSVPGKGSEFWFTAKLERPTDSVCTSFQTPSRPTTNSFHFVDARVLLVEDNPTNQLVAQGILGKMGVLADAVGDGLEALRALELHTYDLVLMDVQMPEMDGFETTRRIRDPNSAVRDHRIPIVAMTANAMQGDRERCLRTGMDDYVPKPISPETLGTVLRNWLPERSEVGDSSTPSAHAADSVDTGMFDWPGLLERMMGDHALARKIVNAARKDIPKQFDLLSAHLERGDLQRAKDALHTLKGLSGNVGGRRLSLLAQAMEETLDSNNPESVNPDVAKLKIEMDRLLDAMG